MGMLEQLAYLQATDVYNSGTRHSFLHNHLHLTQPMRNSAPSRLQNFDDFYVNSVMTSPDFNKAIKPKTTSLTNIFTFDRVPYAGSLNVQCRSRDCHCDIGDGMLVPLNSPTDSDVSTDSSPIDEDRLLQAFLPSMFKDTNNNNGLDGLDPDQLSTKSENADHESCSSSESGTPLASPPTEVQSLEDKFSRLIRRDTFGISKLTLNEVNSISDVETIENKPDGGVIGECSECKDEAGSASSDSSEDDMFIRYEDVAVSSVARQAVTRSLSDSTTPHQPHEQLKRRKSVHFADSRGLDLEIRIPISHVDDYKVPPRLMEALEKIRANVGQGSNEPNNYQRGVFNPLHCHFSLVPNFQQPFLEPTFQRRLRQQNVCLESISIIPNSLSLTGVIRVVNLEFEKQVSVRYTTDNWRTYIDIPACYVSSLSEFQQDQFSFHVVPGNDIKGSRKLEMAVCYRLRRSDREFWDNNYGHNYIVSCLEHMTSNHSDDGMMT